MRNCVGPTSNIDAKSSNNLIILRTDRIFLSRRSQIKISLHYTLSPAVN